MMLSRLLTASVLPLVLLTAAPANALPAVPAPQSIAGSSTQVEKAGVRVHIGWGIGPYHRRYYPYAYHRHYFRPYRIAPRYRFHAPHIYLGAPFYAYPRSYRHYYGRRWR